MQDVLDNDDLMEDECLESEDALEEEMELPFLDQYQG